MTQQAEESWLAQAKTLNPEFAMGHGESSVSLFFPSPPPCKPLLPYRAQGH